MTMKVSVDNCINFGWYSECLQGVLLTLLTESNSGSAAKHGSPNLAQGTLYDCAYHVE